MRDLIFVDTETTGLDPETEQLVELTWSPLLGEPETLFFGVEEVSPFIDNFIKFTERGIAGLKSDNDAFTRFFAASENATMVAANPAFDAAFIKAAGLWRFHYRMLDIETYAMAKLNLSDVPSMKEIHTLLAERGHEIPHPDHTSRGDVLAMKDMFVYLCGL